MRPYSTTITCDAETPVSLFLKLTRDQKYAFLLESVEPHQTVGRYSFIGFDPLILHIFSPKGKENPLEILKKAYEKISYETDPVLPRLQAGFVGYFSYEVARHLEKLNLPLSPAEIPEGIFFLPKNLLVFDHFKHTLTLIAYSKEDLEKLIKRVEGRVEVGNGKIKEVGRASVGNLGFPQNKFEKMVRVAKEKICAGETFQIVISQLFEEKTTAKPFDLYRHLRLISPSPYMYYMQYPDFSIIGSSPETLVRTEGDEIVIRPIAGTRPRGINEEEDKKLEYELLHDIKEQAEHMMLVDLGRNDIGRVALGGSVRVTRLMEVEKYSHVMHIVSEIRGKRNATISLFDIFKTAFPAGTLTGAPKIRAMEIISELEKMPRGIYGGAVGYFDLSGNMDFAIAIRTMLYKKEASKGVVKLRAGAGIVYDSKPEMENQECKNKAMGPLSSLIHYV